MNKYFLSTVAAVAISCSASAAINPTSPFYVPLKGNALLQGEAQWVRIHDETQTDTATALSGMYTPVKGLAITAKVGDLANFNIDRLIDGNPTIPEVGVRFVPCLDGGWKLAAEAGFGFGEYSSDNKGYDYLRGKLSVGYDVTKDILLGAFVDTKYASNFDDDFVSRIQNYGGGFSRIQNYGGGLFGIYSLNDKTTIDLEYRHDFKTRYRFKDGAGAQDFTGKLDEATVSLTYEFKKGAYVTPYGKYVWIPKENIKAFGIRLGVEF